MTMNDLEDQLRGYGMPLEDWGGAKTKSVENLLAEINAGEAMLVEECGTIVRVVHVVGIFVYHGTGLGRQWLRELEQRFDSGLTRRGRNIEASLGEKMLPGEAVQHALARALMEELKQSGEPKLTNLRNVAKTEGSPSYPGLSTRYELHFADYEMPGELYRSEGYEIRDGDKVLVFGWIPSPI